MAPPEPAHGDGDAQLGGPQGIQRHSGLAPHQQNGFENGATEVFGLSTCSEGSVRYAGSQAPIRRGQMAKEQVNRRSAPHQVTSGETLPIPEQVGACKTQKQGHEQPGQRLGAA